MEALDTQTTPWLQTCRKTKTWAPIRDHWMDTTLSPKEVMYWANFVTRRRPGRPLKRPLDGYNPESKTGHVLG